MPPPRVRQDAPLTDSRSCPIPCAMAESAIKSWLQARQRKAVRSAFVYFTAISTAGILALIPTLGIAFLICRIALLILVPSSVHWNSLAWLLTIPLLVLLFADCRRAERDDMALIPLWLAREYFHMGPRLILDGWHRMVRSRQLARVDVERCAEVLAYLLSKTTPTSREELMRIFPSLIWEEIVPQLRCIEGVILFRNIKSVSLLAPLRLELRRIAAASPNTEKPAEEPEIVPVDEPQRLSPAEILGVSNTASAAEIKTAYRSRVKECHPDRFANMDEQSRELAEEWTKAVNAAYAELLTQQNR
jgi:hypothetical protein